LLEIQKPLQSYHAHNEHDKIKDVINQIQKGVNMCLVTDAGTPAISDPGFLIVRACLQNQIEIECLPGATAFVPALVKSGLPSDRFVFEGFIPVKKGRKTRFEALQGETRTMVFYESPYKLIGTLEDCIAYFGADRLASVSRELTKLYEETINGSLAEILAHFKNKAPKGEFVIVIKGHE
jgi:16S rRNA (cytidine1402-2'-O)-methyltransferase